TAAYDDSPTDAGAEYRAEDHHGPLPRPVARLRQRETIGVVGDADLASQRRFKVALDRLPIEADRIRSTQQSRRTRDRAWRADAHASAGPELVVDALHKPGDGIDGRAVIVLR